MPILPTTSGILPGPGLVRPEILVARAIKAEQDGRTAEAIRLYERALKVDPTNIDVLNNLGTLLGLADELMPSIRHFENSLRIEPNQPSTWYYYAVALSKLGLTREALQASEQAIALSPGSGAAHLQRSALLAGLGRHEESLAACIETLRLLPIDPRAAIQHGESLQWCGRYDEAFAEFDRAIAMNSYQAEARVAKATLTLLLGDLPTGFSLYEARWHTSAWHESRRRMLREYTKPLWLGETGIAGKALLIYAEQGYGDAIHFCRYAPLAVAAGARVIVETNEPLVDLMTTLDGVSQVISDKAPQPDHDLRCPMMSLPLAFGTTADTIPGKVPYLRADPARVSRWRDLLSGLRGRRIGLVWGAATFIGDAPLAATSYRKSLPLSMLAPLAAVQGCDFVSLQLGPPAASAAFPPAGMILHDYTADLKDFADTAALMDNLDLVISVCTSTAHLAGALGKPVWLMNRFDTAWQWFLDREDTPWYPTMRVFRQPNPVEWTPVVRSIAIALRAFANAS